jgi:hypothetical protein
MQKNIPLENNISLNFSAINLEVSNGNVCFLMHKMITNEDM